MNLADILRGGHAPTLILGAMLAGLLIFGVAWPLAAFAIKVGALGWRRLFRRSPRAVIDITEGRRRQLQALASERTGR